MSRAFRDETALAYFPEPQSPFVGTIETRHTVVHELAPAQLDYIVAELAKRQYDEWMTVGRTCELLQCDREWLTRLERDGRLVPARPTAGKIFYSRKAIDAFLSSCVEARP